MPAPLLGGRDAGLRTVGPPGTAHAWLRFFTTDCTKSTPWKIKVTSDTPTPFVEGQPIHVALTASATDDWYTTYNENEGLIQATDSKNVVVTAGPGG